MGSPSLLPFQRESSGRFAGIVVVRLEQPSKPVVVLDLPLIQRLDATLKEVQRGSTGNERRRNRGPYLTSREWIRTWTGS